MEWIIIAMASSVLMSIVSVMDKRLLSWHMPGVLSFNLVMGLGQLGWAVLLLSVLGVGTEAGVLPIGLSFLSGFLWGVGVLFLFYVLWDGEVSRAISVFHTYPIFAAILAMAFLGEHLHALQWVGILVTVAGAVVISVNPSEVSSRVFLKRPFFILMLGSVITGGAFVASKVALDEMPLGPMYAVRTSGLAIGLMFFSLRPSVIKQALAFARGRYGGIRIFFFTEVIVAPLAILCTLWAVSLGSVSLVSALTATRPFFVFVFSVVLSMGMWKVLDEPLTRGTLTLKSFAIGMIIGGVTIISLT